MTPAGTPARKCSRSCSRRPKLAALEFDALLFGAELDELRTAAGYTWDELARRSHVSATYLKDLARGRRGQRWPSRTVVEAIAAALDVPPERFLLERARRVLEDPHAVDYAFNALLAGQVGR